MQNVNFNSIEEFFEFIPASESKIVSALRNIVLDCIPDCQEKLSYNVPYYKRNYNICYIWPPAIMWDGFSHQGVHLGSRMAIYCKMKSATWKEAHESRSFGKVSMM